jgi:hypothetical protein
MQAHWNAQQHTDEFVMDLLVSLDKVSLLVQELLVIEVRPAVSHAANKLRQLMEDHVATAAPAAASSNAYSRVCSSSVMRRNPVVPIDSMRAQHSSTLQPHAMWHCKPTPVGSSLSSTEHHAW